MASELNHHVGYSRENECWFVRFYPYQTEQQATEAISEFTRPTPVAPVSPDASFIEAARWHEAEAERKRSVAVKSKRLEAQIATHEASAAHFRSSVPVSPDATCPHDCYPGRPGDCDGSCQHPEPTPDATGKCGELVTAAWQRKHPTEGWMDCREEDIPHYRDRGQEVRELSPRSQAEELLAAERAENEIAERNRDAARENFLTMQKSAAKLLKRAEKAEADNTAKDAEISNLKAINANLMGDDEDKPRYTTKRLRHEIACATEALEADNAAMTARVKELRIDRAAWEAVATDIRKQAKALEAKLAEKDARIKELEAALDSDPDGSGLWRFWSKKSIEANQQLRDKTKTIEALEAKLEADNAAKDARIKALVDENFRHCQTNEALEAKLAAAEKVRKAAEHVVWFDWSDNDDDAVKAVSDLRAVLGGESS